MCVLEWGKEIISLHDYQSRIMWILSKLSKFYRKEQLFQDLCKLFSLVLGTEKHLNIHSRLSFWALANLLTLHGVCFGRTYPELRSILFI